MVSFSGLFTLERRLEIARIAAVAITIFLYWRQIIPIWCLWAAVAAGLYPLAKTGLRDLVTQRRVGTEIFVTIATLIALFGGETIAGAVLMTIILIAEFIADLNMERARSSIRELLGSAPQTAIVKRGNREETVPIESLRRGDIVLVRAGEKVPVDGKITAGGGSLNEAPITGESIPQDKDPGDEVFAGTILESGAIDVETERVGSDTMFGRIVKLVEETEHSQAPVQRLADRVASWLIPVVSVFLVAVFLVTRDIRKIVTLLIFTSPAELGLATPMVMIAAVARAARSGILVKGGAYLERLAKVDVVVFDKTGTLTIGRPAVQKVEILDPALSESELLKLVAAANRRSAHPIARAVVEFAVRKGVEIPEPTDFEVLQGRGVKAKVNGDLVLAGNEMLLQENGIAAPPASPDGGAIVYVAYRGRAVGVLYLSDTVRPGAKAAISQLKESGVKRTCMLTGDNHSTAEAVAAQTGIDEVYSELLPDAKVEIVAELQTKGHSVAMVGDGINDAPALATADVEIAMGAAGSPAAIEAADLALMTDDLSRIVMGRRIAVKAYDTIRQNLLFGVGVVHVLGITAALLGWIGPIQAAVLHVGPDILVFLNSIKLLRVRL